MPILVVCDSCQAKYSLKEEFAGQRLKCKTCGAVLVVPSLDLYGEPRPEKGYHAAFDRDKFLVNQQRIAISEKYYVFSEDQKPILFIVRPAHFLRNLAAAFAAIFTFLLIGGVGLFGALTLSEQLDNKTAAGIVMIVTLFVAIAATISVAIWISPKRHIYIYSDDTKEKLLLEVLQDRKINIIRATYTAVDHVGGPLGRFEKNYLFNFFRKKWTVTAPDGTVTALAREDSLILSLLRRFLGPMLGFLRTNFVIYRPGTDQVIGEFNRKMTLFDRYVLDMSADRAHELDRRMAIALGILLDTGERR